jgi:hypothetical protein
MNKVVMILTSTLIISSCTTNHKQYNLGKLGEYSWNNQFLKNASEDVFKTEFINIKKNCEVEVNKIPVPSPSCILPAENTCSKLTASRLGMCYSAPVQKCDYRAVNIAEQARERKFSGCMQESGWKLEWQPGSGKDISGGVFEYVAADNDNEYFIKKNSASFVNNKYTAVLRIISKDKTKKSFQGVYVFDVFNNTLQIENTEPVLMNENSAAVKLLTIIKALI